MCWNGEGRRKDEAEAVRWWLKAAELENPRAQYDVSTAFELGKGIDADKSLVLYWCAKAASHGLPIAQNKLRRLQEPLVAPPPVAAAPKVAPALTLDPTIADMLTSLNLAEYIPAFAQEKIDLDAAKLLTEEVAFSLNFSLLMYIL